MRKLVGGNWKMNCRLETFKGLADTNTHAFDSVDSFLAVPHVYIPLCRDFFPECISICAQDISEFESGAYTGEVGGAMLSELGVRYAIVGHSERRNSLGETSTQISRKLDSALRHSIRPILCVGEPAEVRESGRHLDFLEKQFIECTDGLAGAEMDVAYEPVWAIGMSRTASREQIREVVQKIRAMMESKGIDGRVIYGGSVTKESAAEVVDVEGLDGVLVGNASLGKEFEDIAWRFAAPEP